MQETIIRDTFICPHCNGEMLRSSTDDFSSDYDKHYICYNCGLDIVVNKQEELEF